jgi:hypothetical protein
MNQPGVAIFLHAGETIPVVFGTWTYPHEKRLFDEWLEQNPPLARLLELAEQTALDAYRKACEAVPA